MKDQYDYLKKLEGVLYKDILVTKNTLREKTYTPGYRVPLTDSNQVIDHRTIGSNEIVFDFDFKSYNLTYKHALMIINVLEERKIPFYVFSTGGKGVHIHIFFDRLEIKNEELRKAFKEAISYNFTWKHVRQFLFELICDEAGVNKAYIGKYIDTQKVNFNDLEDNNVLIRSCGGRNQKFDELTGNTTTNYKTWIPLEEFNDKRVVVSSIDKVRYPVILQSFQLNPYELGTCVKEYLKRCKENKQEAQKHVKLPNGYTGLASVQKIIEGMQEGLRNEGAKIIATALVLDGFGADRAEQTMTQYANNCSQIGHQFFLSEAMNWYNWMKNQEEVFWNNEQVKKLGVWDKDTDDWEKATKKDVLKVLESKGLLKRIDDYLKTIIMGEKETRILLFLLLLSCKFKVDDEWNLSGDPKPQSVIISSLSSSGKSYITKALLKLFGEEGQDYYSFSRMTGATLNYFSEIDMTGKILFVEELQGLDTDNNQLRLWVSEGKLKLASVEKDDDSKNRLKITESKGQPVFITGTAEDSVDEQMNTRSWLISLDISEQQNKAILRYESDISRMVVKKDVDEIRILRDTLKELKSYHFIVPFFDYECLNIPSNDVRIRRDFKKFGDLIRCVTLLHQRQRVVIKDELGNEYLISNLEDYEIAAKYSEKVLSATFSGLTAQQIWLLDTIKEQQWNEEFESGDVQRLTSWSQSKCYNMLKQLEEIGVITSTTKRGVNNQISYGLNPKKKLVNLNLPTREELLENIKIRLFRYFQFLANYDFYYQSTIKTDFGPKSEIAHHLNRLFFNAHNGGEIFAAPMSQFDVTSNTVIGDAINSVHEHPLKNNREKCNIYVTKDMLQLEFKQSKQHLISEEELVKKFGKPVEDLLKKMSHDGDVFSPRPGYWMELN